MDKNDEVETDVPSPEKIKAAIEVEIQEQSILSCFTLNDDGTVTCPVGKILSKVKMRGGNTIYGSKDACV